MMDCADEREGLSLMEGPSSASREWPIGNRVFSLDALSALLLLDLAPHLPSVKIEEYEPIEVQSFAAKALMKSLLKKYEFEDSESANAAAFEKFASVNKACGEWSLKCETREDEMIIGEVRKQLYEFFYPSGSSCILSSFDQILDHGYCGPGASRGAKGGDFYTKLFASPLTYTSSGLYRAYRNYVSRFEPWESAEVLRRSLHGADDCIVSGNVLSFVPKNVDISRCICIEPSLNMFYQLGIKQILEKRLESYFGIDFATQQFKNRDLAQLASMFDNQWVTIDLSSASDSLSLEMIRVLLPGEPLGFLEATRSSHMTLPDGSEMKLNMISTMGNGYTFPLQTAVFASVVCACMRIAGLKIDKPRGKSIGNFGVYGDDIICRTEVLRLVLRGLHLLGFSVNMDKSFFKGPFRESCGGDYFYGHPVRGVYLKSLRTPQDFYVALNLLNRWTARHGIPLPLTCGYLQAYIRPRDRLYVPPCESDDAGIKAPLKAVTFLKRDKHVQAIRYRKYEPKPNKLVATECGVYGPRRREDRTFNPHGLWVSFLAGYVRDGTIGVRHNTVMYRARTAVIPYWDYLPTFSGFAPEDCVMSLEDSYDANSLYWLSTRA